MLLTSTNTDTFALTGVNIRLPAASKNHLIELSEAQKSGDAERINRAAIAIEKKFYPIIKSALGGRCGFREDILDEVCQQTLIRLYLKSDKYDPEKHPEPYVIAVASNIMIDMSRRDKHHARCVRLNISARSVKSDPESEVGPLHNILAGRELEPVAAMIEAEDSKSNKIFLNYIIQFLKEKFGEKSCLVPYLRGQKYQEIADEKVIPVGTVKSRIRKERLWVIENFRNPLTEAA